MFTRRGMASAVAACAAGVFLGVFYTLSPLTVWFGAAMAVLLVSAGRGLGRRERLWVLGLLATAMAARLLAVGVLFLLTAPGDGSFASLLPDEGYTMMRARQLRYEALAVPLSVVEYADRVNPFGQTAVNEALAYVQLVVGDAPYGLRLLSAALYLIGAVVLYRIARSTFGIVAALIGLAAALFLPSLFIWSISTIKEPWFYFATLMSVSAAVVGLRAGSLLKRCGAFVTCAVAIVAVGAMRRGGGAVVAVGLLVGLLLLLWVRRPKTSLGVLAFGGVITVCAIQYPGIEARMIDARNKGEQRLQQAFSQAVLSHWGHINTEGWHYKLLDPEFYRRDAQGNPIPTWMDVEKNFSYPPMVRFAVRAAASFVLVPLPWQAPSAPALAYLPEQVVWYVLVLLALVGTAAGLRRDPALTLLLAGAIVSIGGGIALTSGNIGALVRHRGMVMILLVWLSGLGASVLLNQCAVRIPRKAVPAMEGEGTPCLS